MAAAATLTPSTISTPTGEWPSFLEGVIVVHGAMRRDVDRLPRAIERTTGPEGAVALQRWYAKFEREVLHHHQREDDVVWPTLVQAVPEFAGDLAILDADHHALDDAMTATRDALDALVASFGAGTLATAIEAAGALRQLLHDHLDREEAAMFPLMAQVYTEESYLELEQQLLKATPKKLFAFELPFAFDGLDVDQAASKLAEMPLPIRLLHRLVWQPAYDRLVAPLAGL